MKRTMTIEDAAIAALRAGVPLHEFVIQALKEEADGSDIGDDLVDDSAGRTRGPATATVEPVRVRINHLSLYASDTAKVAADLAFLVGGEALRVGPLRGSGGWTCFLNPPETTNLLDPRVTDFVEVYPRTKRLVIGSDGTASFGDFDASQEKGAAVHMNLNVPLHPVALEDRCRARGLRAVWRGYLPLLDVWLEEDPPLLVELAPPLQYLRGCIGKWSYENRY